jgi:DNA-binding MurR/RpiR family transcriptional regulator
MSSNQRRLAEYLLQNYDRAAFFTALELGKTLDISESTVIRFANFLGYSGFPDLSKDIQNMVQNRITTVDRLKLSLNNPRQNILNYVLTTDMNNIEKTMEDISKEDFTKAVAAISKAKKIYIISMRSGAAVGRYLYYYLNLLLKNCYFLSGDGLIFEELINAGPEDLVIGISISRYTRQTVEGLKLVREKGVQTLAITDSHTSPLARYGQYVLVAHCTMTSFIDSFVAPLSLVNALITAVGSQNERSEEVLAQLEDVWEEFNTFYKDE